MLPHPYLLGLPEKMNSFVTLQLNLETKTTISRRLDAELGIQIVSVHKLRAQKIYSSAEDILLEMERILSRSDAHNLRKQISRGGFDDLLRFFDERIENVNANVQLRKDIELLQNTLEESEKDFRGDVSNFHSAYEKALRDAYRLLDYNADWSYGDEPDDVYWLDIGSVFCTWVLEDGYVNLKLARTDQSKWLLRIDFPRTVDTDDNEIEGAVEVIESSSVNGLLQYVEDNITLNFWRCLRLILDSDLDATELNLLRDTDKKLTRHFAEGGHWRRVRL